MNRSAGSAINGRPLGLVGVLILLGAIAAPRSVQAEEIWRVYLYGNEVSSLAARGEEIWAGTSGGVVSLSPDGGFRQWNRASQGLLSDSVSTVAVDRAGRIWCGTERAGISVFDPERPAWTPFTSLQQPIPSDQIQRIRFLGPAEAESLLVSTQQGFALMVGGDLRGACQEGVDICNLPSYDVRDFLTADGMFWLATARGAASAAPGENWTARSAGLGTAKLTGLARSDSLYASGQVTGQARDGIWTWRDLRWQALPAISGAPSAYRVHDMLGAGDTLFVATTGGVFQRLHGSWSAVGDISPWATAAGDTVEITSLVQTASGRLYAGAADRNERRDGIWELVDGTWRQHRMTQLSLRQHYLSLLFDAEGTLWASAAQRNRLPYILKVEDGVWTILNGGSGGRLNAWTWRMREIGGEIWLGHCCATNETACRIERIREDDAFQAWPPYNVWDLDVDGEGRLWMASTGADAQYANGVYRLDPSDSTWIQVRTGLAGSELLADQVSAIRYDPPYVWIGYEDFGVSRWNLGADGEPRTADDSWIRFQADDATRPLIGDGVRRIEIGPDGRVWVGTTAGLSIWNGTRFTNIGAGFGRLPTADVNDIIPLADGGAWVATRNGGVTRLKLREQGGYFYTTYGPPDLPNPNVNAITLAPDGRSLWLATDRGLAVFVPEEESTTSEPSPLGAYPNPFQPGCADGVRLLGTGGEVRGVVTDLAGRIVARFPADGRASQDPTEPIWDGTDHGRRLAPGVYRVHVQMPRGEKSIGVALIDGPCP